MHQLLGAGFKRRFLGLCVPPLVLALIDGVLTVVGQSDFYWSNHAAVNEANPVFAGLLHLGPFAFVLGAAAWLAMICTMIMVLPRLMSLILSIAITFGHTIGSGSWLFNHFDLGYQLANGYYLFSACLLGVGIRHAIGHGAMEVDVLNVRPVVRWRIGGVVFALAVFVFLYPWRP